MDDDRDVLLKLDSLYGVREIEVIPIQLFLFMRYLNPCILINGAGYSRIHSDNFNNIYSILSTDQDEIISFLRVYPWDESTYILNHFQDLLNTDIKEVLVERLNKSFLPHEVNSVIYYIMKDLNNNSFDFLSILEDAKDYESKV